MIYIFQGVQSICSLPGLCCKACGDACKNCPGACKTVCDPIRQCCSSCGSTFKHFMERPLSAYVVLAIALSLATIGLSVLGLQSKENCKSNFLLILMGFSVIHIIFAIYFQIKVWKAIMDEDNVPQFIDGDAPSETYKGKIGSAAAGMFSQAQQGLAAQGIGSAQAAAPPAQPAEKVAPAGGKIIIPKEIVQKSFKAVFCEDFGVLGMFILLLGMFFLSWIGQDKVDTEEPRCDIGSAQYGGYAFFWFAALYSYCYMCCGCCANKVMIAKDDPAEEEEQQNYEGLTQSP